MITKPDKKSLLYLGIVTIIAIFVCVGSFYFLSQIPEIGEEPEEKKPAEKSMEEIIKDLTTPQGEPEPLPEEIIDDLTSPKKGEKPVPLPEETIEDLTTPK